MAKIHIETKTVGNSSFFDDLIKDVPDGMELIGVVSIHIPDKRVYYSLNTNTTGESTENAPNASKKPYSAHAMRTVSAAPVLNTEEAPMLNRRTPLMVGGAAAHGADIQIPLPYLSDSVRAAIIAIAPERIRIADSIEDGAPRVDITITNGADKESLYQRVVECIGLMTGRPDATLVPVYAIEGAVRDAEIAEIVHSCGINIHKHRLAISQHLRYALERYAQLQSTSTFYTEKYGTEFKIKYKDFTKDGGVMFMICRNPDAAGAVRMEEIFHISYHISSDLSEKRPDGLGIFHGVHHGRHGDEPDRTIRFSPVLMQVLREGRPESYCCQLVGKANVREGLADRYMPIIEAVLNLYLHRHPIVPSAILKRKLEGFSLRVYANAFVHGMNELFSVENVEKLCTSPALCLDYNKHARRSVNVAHALFDSVEQAIASSQLDNYNVTAYPSGAANGVAPAPVADYEAVEAAYLAASIAAQDQRAVLLAARITESEAIQSLNQTKAFMKERKREYKAALQIREATSKNLETKIEKANVANTKLIKKEHDLKIMNARYTSRSALEREVSKLRRVLDSAKAEIIEAREALITADRILSEKNAASEEADVELELAEANIVRSNELTAAAAQHPLLVAERIATRHFTPYLIDQTRSLIKNKIYLSECMVMATQSYRLAYIQGQYVDRIIAELRLLGGRIYLTKPIYEHLSRAEHNYTTLHGYVNSTRVSVVDRAYTLLRDYSSIWSKDPAARPAAAAELVRRKAAMPVNESDIHHMEQIIRLVGTLEADLVYIRTLPFVRGGGNRNTMTVSKRRNGRIHTRKNNDV